MNIKNLQLFIHLCESQNFSQTAEAMHISPSALSRVIQRLEENLGQTLLIRDNRSVELTFAGTKLLPVASLIVSNWLKVKSELQVDQSHEQEKLNLFCSVTASYYHLPIILNKFRTIYPHIEIQLQIGDPALAVNKVLSDDVDIAIAAKPENLPHKLTYIEVDQLQMSLISPKISSPTLQKSVNHDPDWKSLSFILPESGSARARADKWFKKKKITPSIYTQISGHEAIVSMVALGCGVGIAPDLVINNSPVNDKIQRISTELIEPLSLGLCYKQSSKQPLLHALLQLFHDSYLGSLI